MTQVITSGQSQQTQISNEPIRTQSKIMQSVLSAGKRVTTVFDFAPDWLKKIVCSDSLERYTSYLNLLLRFEIQLRRSLKKIFDTAIHQ